MQDLFFKTIGTNACAFGTTPKAHHKHVARRFVMSTLISALTLFILLSFDFVGRYLDLDPTGGFVAVASILSLALLFGFIFAFSKWVFRTQWVLDPAAGSLTLERAFLGRQMKPIESVDLEYIAKWLVEGTEKSCSIQICFTGGEMMPLVGAGAPDCRQLAQSLKSFAKGRRVKVVWEEIVR